ncbi:MAG: DUF3810 domain-containing protein [Peptococcaceae bacterium]
MKRYFIIALLPLGFLISFSLSYRPELIEDYYARVVYQYLARGLSRLTGLLPFSLAELIIIFLVFFSIIVIIRTIFFKKIPVKSLLGGAAMGISLVYFLFILLWGLNYHRQPFAEIAGLEVRPSSVEELEELCTKLIGEVNRLRPFVTENDQGITSNPAGDRDVFARAGEGYRTAAAIYPELGGDFGRPKGVFLSHLMCYTGISGVYFPFTAEANVNTLTPDPMLPATTCHEMAHQRGFAREDEANFIAYLTCTMHPDIYFQYSGNLLALIHSMNALYRYNPVGYRDLSQEYNRGVRDDLKYISDFWDRYEGPVEKISSKINDTYLKANLQREGIYSYGRMVDLLLALARQKG